jgi:hypothetical protein
MKTKLLFFILILSKISFADNFDIFNRLCTHKISFRLFAKSYDTSIGATVHFILKSDSLNVNWETREGKGPIEFFAAVDSVLTHFGRGDNTLITIIESINKSVDGCIANEYAEYIKRYCDKYPDSFKKAIIKEGRNSDILDFYNFSVGFYWKDSFFYKHKSVYNDTIISWGIWQINNSK